MHGQITLQADPRAVQDAPGLPALPGLPASPAATQARERPSRDVEALRHGFTYGHLQALAWVAVRYHTPSRGLDTSDRFEAAWGALAEFLYAAADAPTPLGLVHAGLAGLDRLRKGGLHERGYLRRNRDGGDPATRPVPAGSFYRYWTRPAPSTPEDQAVEATAVRQVLAALSPAHAEALAALAEYEDYELAAAALGLGYGAYTSRLGRARAVFLALWHEHETPPGRRRTDKRLYRRAPRSEPADRADAARSLAGIREAFGGRPTIASTELLAGLADADPSRYGNWDFYDLGAFLSAHGVTRHRVAADGDNRKRVGYRLSDITSALHQLTAPGALEEQAA
jgi:DNA-directed RNA polymerase specialized sigma24 family protein